MPLYEYECTVCGERTEIIQRLSDAPLSECPRCGKPVKKLLSAPSFQFKGSGWYVTDYAGKGSGAGSGSAGGNEKPGGSDKDTATKKTPSKEKAAPGSTKGGKDD